MTETISRPTPERMAHGGIIPAIEERGTGPKPWNAITLPHDCLDMSIGAHQAGHRFHTAYQEAHGSDTKTQSWEKAVDGTSKGDMSAAQADARRDLRKWEKLLAPALYGVLVASCGHGQASSRWAADNQEHPSCGPVMLAAACEQLSRLL